MRTHRTGSIAGQGREVMVVLTFGGCGLSSAGWLGVSGAASAGGCRRGRAGSPACGRTRVARRAAAFGVAEPGVEAGCLEGVGAQGHPVAAAAPDLGFGGGEEPGAQAATALVVAHPEQVDVAAAAPRPAVEPRAQVIIVPVDRDRQQTAV